MQGINWTRAITRGSVDTFLKLSPSLFYQGVEFYNKLVLRGDIERARSLIKVEFQKNRQVAEIFYNKYKDQMDPKTSSIFEEIIGDFDD